MIERGRALVAEEIGDLRQRETALSQILVRKAAPHSVHDLGEARAIVGQSPRQRSAAERQRLRYSLRPRLPVRQKALNLAFDQTA